MASSAGIQYKIIVDAGQVEAMLAEKGTALPGYIAKWLYQSATLVKAEMSRQAPSGVAGALGQGIKNNIGITYTGLTAEIKPTDQVPYADAVETGTRPHMPPAGPDSALAQWAEMKGLNVWAVAMSIKRKGTQPHPYIEPTYEATKEVVAERFNEGVAQYLEVAAL